LDELLARAPRTKRAADCDGEQHGEYERAGTEYTPTHDLRDAGASAQRDHSALPRARTERDPGGNHSHGAKQPAHEPANKTVELERLRDDADPGKAEQADRDERNPLGRFESFRTQVDQDAHAASSDKQQDADLNCGLRGSHLVS
jgi:hypothetical protein